VSTNGTIRCRHCGAEAEHVTVYYRYDSEYDNGYYDDDDNWVEEWETCEEEDSTTAQVEHEHHTGRIYVEIDRATEAECRTCGTYEEAPNGDLKHLLVKTDQLEEALLELDYEIEEVLAVRGKTAARN